MGLVSFITGGDTRLSEEAQRGRKELLLVAAGLWVTPIVTTARDVLLGTAPFGALSLITMLVFNLAIFFALANGRPWARRFTLFLTGMGTLLGLWFLTAAMLGGIPLFGPFTMTVLLNTAVSGTASWVLWRSPAVRAYFASRSGGPIVFPNRVNRAVAALPPVPAPGFKLPPVDRDEAPLVIDSRSPVDDVDEKNARP